MVKPFGSTMTYNTYFFTLNEISFGPFLFVVLKFIQKICYFSSNSFLPNKQWTGQPGVASGLAKSLIFVISLEICGISLHANIFLWRRHKRLAKEDAKSCGQGLLRYSGPKLFQFQPQLKCVLSKVDHIQCNNMHIWQKYKECLIVISCLFSNFLP